MFYRLRHDFHLSIITMLGACAVFGVTPFAIYRLYSGNLAGALVDLFILFTICFTVAYAWVTGDNRRSGFYLALLSCAGGTAVAIMQGDVGIFWLFPAFITSFFLTEPRIAVGLNLLAIGVLAFQPVVFDSQEQMLAFVTTSIVVSCCTYIFAQRAAHQRRRLEMLATHDPLTGVKNRRAMEEDMAAAVSQFTRSQMDYALIILDLDMFKRINDRHGHAVGDEVLVDCARLIQRNTRRNDCLYRFGGEEFVIIMPGVKPAGVRAVAENLRHKLEAELASPSGAVTASFGVASLLGSDNADSWIARADGALYQAKTEGRNRVVIMARRQDASPENDTDAPPEVVPLL
ncbi:GGDEF domain-containing protein [Marinobacter sp. BGYM27]|uniref:GGDEF domain-containing protein n=1 Tax=Marinobacter sp. BGYM27 TaxID=2975597 RepID=UPI0021A3807E|nr:GGDEF domain-containing protein [Marinobacter sp. BGYM27]MDG5500033.1 GGDEF domain-containing protein [Marinobacter sp. BGYM27]